MQIPITLKPALLGAVGGAVTLAILGFTWGGWVSAASADASAKQRSLAAVTAALAPICHDNFRRGSDMAAKLAELKKVGTWEQAGFIEKGGWAKMPGTATVDSAMARACADLIVADKS